MIQDPGTSEADSSALMEVNQQQFDDYMEAIPVESQEEQDLLNKIMNYDVNKIPPSLEAALIHYECNRFGQEKSAFDVESFQFCPCCGSLQQKAFAFSTDSKKFDFYGPIIPLFFQLAKHLTLLSLVYALAGAFVQVNIYRENAKKKPDWGFYEQVVNTNNMDRETYYNKAANFLFPCLWLFSIVFYFFVQDQQTRLALQIKKKRPTASDYTLMIHNVEPQEEKYDFILELIKSRVFVTVGSSATIEIERIIYGKYEGNLARLNHKIENSRRAVFALEDHLEQGLEEKSAKVFMKKLKVARELYNKYKRSYQKYKKICRDDKDKSKYSIAFVTLSTPTQAQMVSPVGTNSYIISQIFPCLFKNKVHIIEPAHEPDDIKWKFIGYSPFETFCSVFVSYSLYVIVVAVSFAIQLGTRILQNWWTTVTPLLVSNKYVLMVINMPFLTSFVVNVLNFIVILFTSNLTKNERHLSESEATLSHARKLIWLQFINSAGFPIALWIISHIKNYEESQYKHREVTAISKYVLSMLITNIFMNPLMHAVNPSFLYKTWWVRRRIEKRLLAGEAVDMTQKELNMLYEPQELSLHVRYASLVRTFFVSCFFFDIMPFGMVLCFLFMLTQYWVDKYMLVNRYKRIPRLHQDLAYGAVQIAEFGGCLFVLGHMIFKYRKFFVFEEAEGYPLSTRILDLAFVFISYLVPLLSMRVILIQNEDQKEEREELLGESMNTETYGNERSIQDPDLMFEMMHQEGREVPFQEIWTELDVDFDRSNPLTKEEATKRWRTAKMGNSTGEPIKLPDPKKDEESKEGLDKMVNSLLVQDYPEIFTDGEIQDHKDDGEKGEENAQQIEVQRSHRSTRFQSNVTKEAITNQAVAIDLTEADNPKIDWRIQSEFGAGVSQVRQKEKRRVGINRTRGMTGYLQMDLDENKDEDFLDIVTNMRRNLYGGLKK